MLHAQRSIPVAVPTFIYFTNDEGLYDSVFPTNFLYLQSIHFEKVYFFQMSATLLSKVTLPNVPSASPSPAPAVCCCLSPVLQGTLQGLSLFTGKTLKLAPAFLLHTQQLLYCLKIWYLPAKLIFISKSQMFLKQVPTL